MEWHRAPAANPVAPGSYHRGMQFAPEALFGRRDGDAPAMRRWRAWHFAVLFVLGLAIGFVIACTLARR